MTMLALVEGHPNIDVMGFYVLASAILVATLYYFHTRPDRSCRTEWLVVFRQFIRTGQSNTRSL
jgi:hypothetical protein